MNLLMIKISVIVFFVLPAFSARIEPETLQESFQLTESIYTRFENETFTDRMIAWSGQYNYLNHRQFQQSLDSVYQKLTEIHHRQKRFLQEIEAYEDDNWDALYGQSGLWRNLKARIQQLEYVLTEIELFQSLNLKSSKERKALLLTYSSQKTDNDNPHTHCVMEVIQAWLQKPFTKGDFDRLIKKLHEKECVREYPIRFQLAMLALKASNSSLIKSLIEQSDTAIFHAGLFLLNDMKNSNAFITREVIDSKSPLEIDLISLAIWKHQLKGYIDILTLTLENSEFQSPAVYLAAAECIQTINPSTAIEYYKKAAEKQQENPHPNIRLTSKEIALKAVIQAYQLYIADQHHAEKALKALDYYCGQTTIQSDEQIHYLYAKLLLTNESEKAKQILTDIQNNKGSLSKRAQLDLIELDLQQNQNLPDSKDDLLDIIEIESDQTNRNLSMDALEVYCKILLQEKSPESLETLLKTIHKYHLYGERRWEQYRYQAFIYLQNYPLAAITLHQLIDPNSCEWMEDAVFLVDHLSLELKSFGSLESRPAYLYIIPLTDLAQYALDCSYDNPDLINLRLAELNAYAAYWDLQMNQQHESSLKQAVFYEEKIDSTKLNNSSDWIRMKARMALAKQNYPAAKKRWGQLVNRLKTANNRFYEDQYWWQAKYYQLLSFSKIADTTPNDLSRAINILLNTYPCNTQNLEFWRRQIEALIPENSN